MQAERVCYVLLILAYIRAADLIAVAWTCCRLCLELGTKEAVRGRQRILTGIIKL
jgi:hypothetical protein